jgi:hypothetical protein
LACSSCFSGTGGSVPLRPVAPSLFQDRSIRFGEKAPLSERGVLADLRRHTGLRQAMALVPQNGEEAPVISLRDGCPKNALALAMPPRHTRGMLTLFGASALTFMMLMYAFERRHRLFILAFAVGCALSSAYGFLAGTWPFGVVEVLWVLIAVRRYFTPAVGRPLTAGPQRAAR